MDLQDSDDFPTILLKVSKMLVEEDLKELKYLVKYKDVNRSELARAKTGLEIFELMEESGIINVQNTKQLQVWLETIGNTEASRILQRFNPKEIIHVPNIKAPTNLNVSKIVKHFKPTKKLMQLKEETDSTNFVVLKGLLGSGKSQMALKYGCEFKKHNKLSIVWKLNCKDLTSLQTSLKTCVLVLT